MFPSVEHPHHFLGDFPLGKQHTEDSVPEEGLWFFQFEGRGDAEYVFVAIETAIRDENVAMGIEAEEVAKGLHGNDGAGDGLFSRDRLMKEDLQGFPGAADESGKELSIVEEVSAKVFRDAEDKMPVGGLFEDIHAQPLSEFHHALLMAERAEVAALAGKGKEVFMAAVFAFHTGKAVVQVAAIEVAVYHLLDIGAPEPILP